MTYPCR